MKPQSQLDPWRIICRHIFQLSSYDIPAIVDGTGLTVDWTLTKKQDYSDKYRKQAYRPRINVAYDLLSSEDRLRVAYIIANELVQRNLGDKLNFDLQKIGWKIDNAQLIPNNEDIRELFFPKKAQHDAYIAIRRIMQEAKTMITIIDPYIDSSLFSALSAIPTNTLNIHLLTQNIPNDFLQEAKKFIMQYNSFTLEIRRSTELHDRFIIIDNKDCWHIGASIKDAGNKAFMLSKLEDLNNRNALLTQLRDSWSNGILVNI